jgi:hypothetical protein
MDRVLVAASQEGRHKLRKILAGVQADYVTSYAGGVEALMRNSYPLIVVDVLFAESRMLKFARNVKEEQPSAQVACVNVTGYPLNEAARSEIDKRLARLGYDGIVDVMSGWEGPERRRPAAEAGPVPFRT